MDQWNVAMCGAGSVGKTALVEQLIMEYFFGTYVFDPIPEKSYRKQFSIDGQLRMLELMDPEGPKDFATLLNLWRSHIDIHGFILMYSIDSRDSFEGVERYYQDLIRTNDGTSKLVLVGNKVDKLDQREVTSDEGYALARRLGCPFFETSAKTRVNVEEAFSALVRILHDSEAKKLETPAPMAGARGKGEKQMSRRWQKRCVVF